MPMKAFCLKRCRLALTSAPLFVAIGTSSVRAEEGWQPAIASHHSVNPDAEADIREEGAHLKLGVFVINPAQD